MSRRLWYPQLDVYDAIRRMAGLLSFWDMDRPPSPERLYIADFYLANPPLLHRTHMPREVRNDFYSLRVPHPEKGFVNLPSAPILFQRMDEVQRQALRTLAGKGLLECEALERGVVMPSEAGHTLFNERFAPLLSENEKQIATFIVNTFAPGGTDLAVLRRNTGLRRVLR